MIIRDILMAIIMITGLTYAWFISPKGTPKKYIILALINGLIAFSISLVGDIRGSYPTVFAFLGLLSLILLVYFLFKLWLSSKIVCKTLSELEEKKKR